MKKTRSDEEKNAQQITDIIELIALLLPMLTSIKKYFLSTECVLR